MVILKHFFVKLCLVPTYGYQGMFKICLHAVLGCPDILKIFNKLIDHHAGYVQVSFSRETHLYFESTFAVGREEITFLAVAVL